MGVLQVERATPPQLSWDPELTRCPQCLEEGRRARIGLRRGICSMCNNFARATERRLWKRMRELHPELFMTLRRRVEFEVFTETMERWDAAHPETAPKRRAEQERG